MRRTLMTILLLFALFSGACWWMNGHDQATTSDDRLPIARWETNTLKHGESLTALFHRLKLPEATLRNLIKDKKTKKILSHLPAGLHVSLGFDEKNQLTALHYKIDDRTEQFFEKHQDQRFHEKSFTAPLNSRIQFASGIISHSLTESAKKYGLSKNLAAQLEHIFSGNIHFETGLRPGDHYRLLFREFYLNGKPYKTGPILIAEFNNQRKTYRAIRYTYPKNHSAYFTLNGKGVEPLFLSRPLHYKRISSSFSYLRFDPYLHKLHSHLGVDFAAPRGTPVKAIGDGKILFCKKTKGYGNEIIVRFSRKYKALYGHLHRFARGIHAGKHVHKGQIIGYVGSTGWSTGPHLHFGLYVYGIPRNPLALKLPSGGAVPTSYLADYKAHANDLLSHLRVHDAPAFANNERNKNISED